MKIQVIEKAFVVWNGGEWVAPDYLSFPVLVYATTAGKAKAKAFCDVHYERYEPEFKDLKARRSFDDDIVIIDGIRGKKGILISVIEHKIEYNKWRNEMVAFVNEDPNRLVYIVSGEHNAYWRSNCSGYCYDIEGAGIYTAADAWNATSHCGLSKQIYFQPVKS